MSRYRLLPTPTQEAVLRSHCSHARYIWSLAVQQQALRDFAHAVAAFFDPHNPG